MGRRFFLCFMWLYIIYNANADDTIQETEDIICKKDGFLPHPKNCKAFYWCTLRRRAKAIILECEENKIFDTDTQQCTYPWMSTREECGGTLHKSLKETENLEKARSLDIELIPQQRYPRNPNNICTQEGFMGDENDCTKFYRCVDNGGGKFAKYDFSCAPGTVWDSDINSCNHPWSVKSKCGQLSNTSSAETYHNEIYYPPDGNYNANAEQPYPIVQPPQNGYPSQGQQPSQEYNPNPNPQQPPNGYYPYPQQPQEGYNPNPSIDNNPNNYPQQSQGGYNPNPPVDNNPNNYPQQPQGGYNPNLPVNNNPNKYPQSPQGGYNPNPSVDNNPQQSQGGYNPNPSEQATQGSNNPVSREPETSTSNSGQTTSVPPITDNEINNSDSTECKQEGFLGDNNDCKKFYRCVDNGKGGFIKYEFSCGEGTVWDSDIQACNHRWAVKNDKCRYGGNQIDSANTNSESNNENSGVKEPNETSSNNEHVNGNVDQTSNNQITESTTQQSQSSSTEQSNISELSSSTLSPAEQTSSSSTSEPNNISESSSTSSNTETSSNTDNNDNTAQECTEEDFIPDKNDCKKFYRCVKGERKSFIKYEFTCGEGTVWDSDAKTCNYPWATRNQCGTGTSNTDSSGDNKNENSTTENGIESTTSTIIESQTSSTISEIKPDTSTTKLPDTSGELITDNQSTTASISTVETSTLMGTSTNKPSEVSQKYDECKEDGFIGDSQNCQKFYRCVDNGKGDFTKYEFTCGEGTVWDNEQSTCNYPSAVKRDCQNTLSTIDNENKENANETLNEIDNTSTSSPESANESSSLTESSSTTESSVDSSLPQQKNDCKTSGFIGDSKDCKKFYRCVENGNGGYTKYEFTCGEGTVWDSTLDTCNYPWAVENNPCDTKGSDNKQEQSTATNPSESSSTEISTTTGTSEQSSSSNGTTTSSESISESSSLSTNTPELTSTTEQLSSISPEISTTEKPDQQSTLTSSETITPSTATTELSSSSTTIPELSTSTEVSSTQPEPSTTESTDQQSTSDIIIPSESTSTNNPELTSSTKVSTTSPESSTTEKTNQQSTSETITPSESTTESISTINPELNTSSTSSESSTTENIDQQSSTTTISTETSEQTSTQTSSEQSTTNGITTSQTVEQTTAEKSESTTGSPTSTTEKSPDKMNETTSSMSASMQNKCDKEGFFPNVNNCNKFYRCVSNGKGGFTKYDFNCGGGTIWDPDLDTCNHPYAVTNKICEKGAQIKPTDQCTEGGYFPSSADCKKFFRCVENGRGGFNKYEFTCGEGTIWDPNTLSCNYPSATDNKACGHRGDNAPPSPDKEQTTEKASTTTLSAQTTTEVQKEISTTEQTSTTEKEKEQSTTSTEISTTTTENGKEQSTTSETTTTETSTTTTENEKEQSITTTSQTTPSETTTTTEQSTTTPLSSETTTSEALSTTTEREIEQTTQPETLSTTTSDTLTTTISDKTTEQTTLIELVTSTTEQTTTETANESTSQQTETTTSEQQETTTSTTEESERTTLQPDSITSTVAGITATTTEQQETTTTEESEKTTLSAETTTSAVAGTTTSQTEVTGISEIVSTPNPEMNQTTAPCPISQLEGDQMALVCPTGFKRHPKYCNLFYQCTTNPQTYEINVLVISCPGRRIYDDDKIQCLPPEETDQQCDGELAEKQQFRRFGKTVLPMEIDNEKPLCPNEGSFPMEPKQCDKNFIKCHHAKTEKRSMRGFIYQCPENYTYWSVSKRCEQQSPALGCEAEEQHGKNWKIPIENENISGKSRMIDVRIKKF